MPETREPPPLTEDDMRFLRALMNGEWMMTERGYGHLRRIVRKREAFGTAP
jgi:hypothetical protein